MGQVDPAFIQELQHRPNLSFTVDDGIPTIDLSRPRDDPSLVTEIGNACKKWGFFQVINHGVPAEKRSRIEDAARSFFALPLEEKTKVRRDEKRVLGYYDTEHTKNVRDWKEVFDITAHDPTCVPASYYPEDSEVTWWRNQWPEHPHDMR
ncbi:hypothetical protein MLD38_032097 [Melastoma candidum]|nr:hypothetical protein MLD38_032097 [Melastoma candidum]